MIDLFSNSVSVSLEISIPDDLLGVEELEAELQEVLTDVILEAGSFWETEAGRRLTTSRDKYIESLSVDMEGDTATLSLTGEFAIGIENGIDPFDMKPGFLSSPKLRTGPVRMPRAVAASLPKSKLGSARQWMVIPLNTKRDPSGVPDTFRMFTDKQPASMWIHPGTRGVHILDAVKEEIVERLLPAHLDALFEKLYG